MSESLERQAVPEESEKEQGTLNWYSWKVDIKMEPLCNRNNFITNHKFRRSLADLEDFMEKENECSEESHPEHRLFPECKLLMQMGENRLRAIYILITERHMSFGLLNGSSRLA